MIAHPLLVRRVYRRSLMLEEGFATELEPVLSQYLIHGASPERLAGVLGGSEFSRWGGDNLVERIGNVGVIAVEGTLVHRGAWIGSHCDMTSYQGLAAQIAEARNDPAIRGVILEFNTPGGEVSGADDCARALAELSAEKETIAICTDEAYSAGYLLASQCREIIVPVNGGVGSIGVIFLHYDRSGAMEKTGVKVSIIAAGKHKAEGNPFEALPSDVRERYAADAERTRQWFAEVVARGRGKRLGKAAALATEARPYPDFEAVQAGLADLVASPSAACAAFIERHA